MREPYIVSALLALKPGAEWTTRGDNYSDLEWLDKSQTKPTEEELNNKISELKAAEPFKLLREERNKRIFRSFYDLDLAKTRYVINAAYLYHWKRKINFRANLALSSVGADDQETTEFFRNNRNSVSYTHLTLPTTYTV